MKNASLKNMAGIAAAIVAVLCMACSAAKAGDSQDNGRSEFIASDPSDNTTGNTKNPDISRNQGSPLHYPDRTTRTSNAPNEDSNYSGPFSTQNPAKDDYLISK